MTNLQIMKKIKQVIKYENEYSIKCNIYETTENTIDRSPEYAVEVTIQFKHHDMNSNNVYRSEFECIALDFSTDLTQVKKQFKKVTNYLKKHINDIEIDDIPYHV